MRQPLPSPIPGPPGRFGLRNALRLSGNELPALQRLAERYGDVVQLRVMGSRWVLISHPDDIETVLVKSAKKVVRDEQARALRRILGLGLLTSEGELWRGQRKLMAQAFTPKRIKSYGDTMVEVGERRARWSDDSALNLHDEMARLTLDVVAAVLFGTGVSAADVEVVQEGMRAFSEWYGASFEHLLGVPRWVPTPVHRRLERATARLDQVIDRIIQERRRSEERSDLLGTLLAATDDDGAAMDAPQLRDEVKTLFLAGYETTALALTHTLYLLGTHPWIEERVLAEMDEVVGAGPLTPDVAKKLKVTERVLTESLRLYPPVWATAREAQAPIELRGHVIEPGTQVAAAEWIVHRDRRWYPDPEAFDPDRWLPERAQAIPRFAYFPFGGGPRVCIGNHFAMLEATLLLAVLLRRYHFEVQSHQTLSFFPAVTLRPKDGGLRVRVRRR